jgi:hypothetical protein
MSNRAYSIAVSNVATTAAASTQIHTMIYQPAAVLTRAQIFDLMISSPATPADNVIDWALTRTAVIPATGGGIKVCQPMEYNDPVASTLGWSIPASGAVITAPHLMVMSVNQRVTWRWCAVPGGEIWLASVVAYGAGLACLVNANTPNCSSSIFFRE